MSPLVALIVCALAPGPQGLELRPEPTPEALVLSGGRVWTGGAFVERTLYVADGRFREAPAPDARVIELDGRFVVPPYADAHVHHFTRAGSAAESRKLFLERGFVYVANLCGPHGAREATAAFTNRPDGVDVLFAHGALTGRTAHPIPLYRTLDRRRSLPEEGFWERNDDNVFYRVDSAETLERKLDHLLGTGPDLVKIIQSRILLEEPGSSDALDPLLVPTIVERAHAAGLRVVAHVDDRADFEWVVGAGVDWIAHTPGYGRRPDEPLDDFLLRPADAEAAASAGVVVLTTAGAYDGTRADNAAAQEAVDRNLATLRAAGVTIGFGSDDWRGPDVELRALLGHVGLSSAELLRLLCETTPRILFPERAIGALEPDHEASMLVLAGDPLEDPANLGRIELVVKQGAVLASR